MNDWACVSSVKQLRPWKVNPLLPHKSTSTALDSFVVMGSEVKGAPGSHVSPRAPDTARDNFVVGSDLNGFSRVQVVGQAGQAGAAAAELDLNEDSDEEPAGEEDGAPEEPAEPPVSFL
ncbi:hypothetical protein CYMTET_27637 [Cymbomonas tetramitiformis]|uniref:Uncharacterized protein n=1 Tax=Cymbomonas tetramitiformis TaxID=36881 RepID=A0AAE0KWZ1_9CHLO|nr:hypothetical protein CYMTET_27637 [Cymbomonas tetramitiformis]